MRPTSMKDKAVSGLFALYTAGLFLTAVLYAAMDFGRGEPAMYAFVTFLLCAAFAVSRFSPGRAWGFLAFSAALQAPALLLYHLIGAVPFNWRFGGGSGALSAALGFRIHLPLLLLGLGLTYLGYRAQKSASSEI